MQRNRQKPRSRPNPDSQTQINAQQNLQNNIQNGEPTFFQQNSFWKALLQQKIFQMLLNSLYLLRCHIMPLLFSLLCLSTLFYQDFLKSCWPVFYTEKDYKEMFQDLDHKMPIHPKNFTQAYYLGYYAAQLTEGDNYGVLQKIAELIGRSKVDKEQVLEVLKTIHDIDGEKGFVSKVLGLFNFINFIWFLSIIGITLTVLPAFNYFFGNVFRQLVQILVVYTFNIIIRPLCLFIYYKIIKPVHQFCKYWQMINNFRPIYEILCYLLVFTVMLEGLRMPQSVGFYFTITGLFLSPFCVARSSLNLKLQKYLQFPTQTGITFYFSLHVFPFAIIYQSTFLGYMCVILLQQAMGFMFFNTSLCWYIGFNSEDNKDRVVLSSLILITLFSLLRFFEIDSMQSPYYHRYLKPFNSAVNVFCTLTLYLGLLLNSCYISRHYSSSLLISHLHMVAALFFGLWFGSVYSQPGLRNTAITFLVLYAMQLSSEFYFKYLFANMVVYVFLVSVAGFVICMWLNMHPEFVMQIFYL